MATKQKRQKPKRKYWYAITYYECPLCSKGDEVRERVYSKAKATREVVTTSGCTSHFL